MATVSKLTSVGDHYITGEYDEYTLQNTIPNNSYAVQFNGTSQYLSLASNTAFDQNGAFTFECWVYKTSSSGSGYFMAQLYPGYLCLAYDSNLNFVVDKSSVGNQIISINTFAINTWHHVAMACDGTTTRLFVNGTLQGSAATTGSASGATLTIGRYLTGTNYFPGYISNVRFVKGTALYTSNFIPQSSPLTAITNTSLLTCQNLTIIDNSTNAFTITNNGSATTYKSPYSSFYSAYFNAQFLATPSNTAFALGTGDFTVETWIYWTGSLSGGSWIADFRQSGAANQTKPQLNIGTDGSLRMHVGTTNVINSGASIISFNTWYHVAMVRSSGVSKLYVNGSQVGNSYTDTNDYGTTAQDMVIGQVGDSRGYVSTYFYGYMSNFRVVKGASVYTSNFTPPFSQLTNITNTSLLTCQNQTIIDNSTNAFTITNSGGVTTRPPINFLSLKQKQLSNGDLDILGEFDEVTYYQDYLRMYSNALNTSSNLSQYISPGFTTTTNQLWTMECWVYFTRNLYNFAGGGYMATVMSGSNTNNGFGGIWWLFTGTATTIANLSVIPLSSYTGFSMGASGLNIQLNTWYHIAASRNGGTGAIWINGVKTNASGNGRTESYNAFPMRIGVALDNPGWAGYFPGHISNFRVIEGSNLYSISSTNITVPTQPLKSITGTTALCCQSSTISGGVNSPTVSTLNPFGEIYKSKQVSNGSIGITGSFDEYTMSNGIYSMLFGGNSGEYLTIPSGVLVFGTNNFTVEAWIYTTAYNISGNGGEVIIDNYMSQTSGSYSVGQWTLWINSSGALSFNYTSSTTVAVTITGTTVTAFAWNHVAVVRNGTTITLYLNGASVASGTYAGTIGATGTSYIGGQAAGSGLTYRYAGSISNLRVLNSTALYTSNFTVPTRPLTVNSNTTPPFPMLPTANTTLLTCQLPIVDDNSPNRYIIGNPNSLTPSIIPNKFYTAVFDGGFINTMIQTPNNARYNVFGVSASTIEFYYYSRSTRAGHLCIVGIGNQDRAYIISNGASLTVGTAIAGIYNTRITSPTSIVQYRWYHVALTRVGSTVSLYLDGVLQGSSTASFYSNSGGVTVTFGTQPYGGGSSNDWYIGLMSNIRILNGTALYTGNFTPPTDRLTAITNTVLLTLVSSAGIVDETGLATLSNPRALPYNAALF